MSTFALVYEILSDDLFSFFWSSREIGRVSSQLIQNSELAGAYQLGTTNSGRFYVGDETLEYPFPQKRSLFLMPYSGILTLGTNAEKFLDSLQEILPEVQRYNLSPDTLAVLGTYDGDRGWKSN